MIIVKNKYFPFKGFKGAALYPFIFLRLKPDEIGSQITINHEKIHIEQQKELFVIGFYIVYFVFWLLYGYYLNPFEIEAYRHANFSGYLKARKRFNWTNYL